jgi:hypothetical protein
MAEPVAEYAFDGTEAYEKLLTLGTRFTTTIPRDFHNGTIFDKAIFDPMKHVNGPNKPSPSAKHMPSRRTTERTACAVSTSWRKF